jgi:hypothetical protein
MQLGAYDLDLKTLHVNRVSHGKAPGVNPPELSPDDAPRAELGNSGRSTYGGIKLGEYLPELKGRDLIAQVDKMRRTDAQIKSSLLLIKAPVLSSMWWVEPFSSDPEDVAVAEYVWWCFNNAHKPFTSILKESLYALDYGHYVQEPVYEVVEYTPPHKWARPRLVAKWVDFAPRHPLTMREVEYDDRHGRVDGWWHMPGGRYADRKKLPIDRLIVHTWDEEANDPRGTSILRSAYPHYYYKHHLYKVDGIQKERHGIGIPDIELAPGFSEDDKNLAHEIGRNLRTNEKAYVVRPPGMSIGFLEPKGNLTNALESADHHDWQIAKNVLTQFINTASAESGKQSGAQVDVFHKVMHYLTTWVADPFNHQAIPQLVDYSFKVKGYPKLRVRRLGESADLRAFAVAVRNLVEPGLISAGPNTERYLREVYDLPNESDEIMDRTPEERAAKPGTEPPEANNENRDDPGNASTGKSPSGNPTE